MSESNDQTISEDAMNSMNELVEQYKTVDCDTKACINSVQTFKDLPELSWWNNDSMVNIRSMSSSRIFSMCYNFAKLFIYDQVRILVVKNNADEYNVVDGNHRFEVYKILLDSKWWEEHPNYERRSTN